MGFPKKGMASLSLKNVKKIYPVREKDKKSKKKKESSNEKKANLQITKEGVVAVQEFNLEIADQEFIVLVGPSGCGKSTTLRMVAGLEEITEGEVHIGDMLVNDVEPKDRDIAMVFQNYALYPHMTVYENLSFALKLQKVKKAEIDVKVKEAAEILGITDLLHRKPKALSGGQRQRVAIGRAIVRHPKVFLMDEPLSNLDAKLRNQMRAELIMLRQRVNTTFIYVTHDQTEAMTLGDRIVVMKDGFIQQIGTPQEVFDYPKNLFVAGFIGAPQMNIIEEAELEESNGIYGVKVHGRYIELPKEKQQLLADKKVSSCPITIGIRPDHIKVTSKSDSFEGVVQIHEMMGSQVHFHIEFNDKDIVIIVPTVEVSKTHGKINDIKKINFDINGDVMHLFCKETGENLIY